MQPVEQFLGPLFLVFSAGVAAAALVMVGAGVKAYAETERRVMVYLSVGFALVVAATVATAIGAVMNDFANPRTLLAVNNGVSFAGYLFVIYSVVSYR